MKKSEFNPEYGFVVRIKQLVDTIRSPGPGDYEPYRQCFKNSHKFNLEPRFKKLKFDKKNKFLEKLLL